MADESLNDERLGTDAWGIVFFWDSGWGWMMGASDIFWEIYRLQLRHSKIERNELASTQMSTKDKTHRKKKYIRPKASEHPPLASGCT
jgi:hypothetical protein